VTSVAVRATFYTSHLFTSCKPRGVGELRQLRTPRSCK
jgi:hypothetical protein